jgi:hypothetical protein
MSVSEAKSTDAPEEPYKIRIGSQGKHRKNTLSDCDLPHPADRMSDSRPSKTDAPEEPYKYASGSEKHYRCSTRDPFCPIRVASTERAGVFQR